MCLTGGAAIDSGSCQVLTIAHAHGRVVLRAETVETVGGLSDKRRWWSGRESVSKQGDPG